MKTNRIICVVKREFKDRVMKKSFIILTLLTPFLFGALMIVPSLLWMVKSEKVNRIQVYDATGFMYQGLMENLPKPDEKDPKNDGFVSEVIFSEIGDEKQLDRIIKSASESKSETDGVLEIRSDDNNEIVCTFFGRNISNIKLVNTLERTLNRVLLKSQLKKNNISDEVAKDLSKRVDIKAVKLESGGKKKESSFLKEYLKAAMITMLLYMLIFGYGQTLMRGVMEEKTSRVVEVLLSSLKPSELLLGKVVGIASVGLLQYLIWMLCGAGLFLANPFNFTATMDRSLVKPEDLILFVVFFGLGFFFYASIFAAFGAICSTDQETQQLIMPIVMILIMPMLILGLILQNPHAGWVVALSLIPLFSPTLMMTRIAVVSVPLWEIIASIAFLVLGIWFMSWAGGKIYRIGILMTGKRPNLIEVFKWLKAS
ncbi:MAG TPA: ABC transporter permease [Acidobacteriota bacterium]|jgi:ABC-2 type transport system permease protein|nr:ABC transporter permease [Acidobacteriota bacterium]HNT18227.1 ABC transporter permease [Acidobacteriota bacterium]HPA27314.1 ABC transporter permease [Acidobacteriota bacterium]HQO20739.1 ABC transporter permease [Acidobacteriota bacterium]HQQ45788.1 ABC transporter permease [Acidobacteriota bacterium]